MIPGYVFTVNIVRPVPGDDSTTTPATGAPLC